jgi:O-antigen ligase
VTAIVERALFALFMLVVVLAPLPLGSNREWSWTLCAALIGGIGILWGLAALLDRRLCHPHSATVSVFAIVFLAVIGWALLQASSLAPAEWAHPLWGMAGQVLDGDQSALAGRVSLAPDDTLTAVMRLLSYGVVFWLAFQFGRKEQRARRTLQWLVAAGIAYAIYGLYNFWSGSETFFWFENAAYKSDVRGTFVNRNHYANYTGLVLLCALALFYRKTVVEAPAPAPVPSGGRIPRGARVTTASDRVEQFALAVWKPLLVILLLSTALILTHSRGGFLSTLAGAAALLWALTSRRKLRSAGARAAIVAGAAIAAIAFWLTSEVLLQRIDQKGLEDNLRFSAYELVRESAGENPLLGFGYGTFADSFRLYRSDDITGYLDRAHNTYLENIFELGWPAALLLFALVASAALICVRGVRRRGKNWFYPALGIAATVLTAIHAWFDFSLQIPAVAIVYACIMGVACAQSWSSRGRG